MVDAPVSSTGEFAVPGISVVIPTRGRPSLLARAIEAVLADPATTEVVVVIDGPDDETEQALHGFALDDPRVRIAHAPALHGAPRGEQRMRDHGARLAREEVVLALDDDIVAAPGMVSGHARWHGTASDLVVLGYMPVAPPPPGGRWSAATRLYAENYERACDAFDQAPESILTGLWGGNFSVRREHWLRADELEKVRLGSMHTDREFGLRLHRLGLRGKFDRGLRAVHHDHRSVTRLVEAALGSAVATARFRQAGVVPPGPRMRSRYARWVVIGLLAVTRPPRVWAMTVRLFTWLTGFAYARKLATAEYALTRVLWRLTYERELVDARRAGTS